MKINIKNAIKKYIILSDKLILIVIDNINLIEDRFFALYKF